MKRLKGILARILTIAMVLTCIPVRAYAAEADITVPGIENTVAETVSGMEAAGDILSGNAKIQEEAEIEEETASEDEIDVQTVSDESVEKTVSEDAQAEESVSGDIAENAGDTAYKYTVRVIDADGNTYDADHPIELHIDAKGVGETASVRVELTEVSGGKKIILENNESLSNLTGLLYVSEIISYRIRRNDDILDLSRKSLPVRKVLTDENIEGIQLLLQASEDISTSSDNYSLNVHMYAYDDKWESFDVDIPIRVTPAPEGTSYSVPEEVTLLETKKEAMEAIRDLVNRRYNEKDSKPGNNNSSHKVFAHIYVNNDIFRGNSIDLLKVYDFYAEREDMKPWEGDYTYNEIMNRDTREFSYEDPYCKKSVWIGEGSYDCYEINLPTITTLGEEKQVDAKIKTLMNTTFAGVKTGSDAQKIKAVYDYVTGHVASSTGDRTTPLYHTAYNALINGHGTCEAYAQLFTRLTRELGVPSRVIMGVDANNHTYNIVRNGEYWYYIDCSQKIYLKDAKSFARAKEQARFLSDEFVNNYLSKLKNAAYREKSFVAIEYDVSGNEADRHEYSAWYTDSADSEPDDSIGVKNWVLRHAALSKNNTFLIRSNTDMSLRLSEEDRVRFDFSEYPNSCESRVTVDLQGHTVKFAENCGAGFSLALKKLCNGNLSMARTYVNTNYNDILLENITINGGYFTPLLDIRLKDVTIKNSDVRATEVMESDSWEGEKIYDFLSRKVTVSGQLNMVNSCFAPYEIEIAPGNSRLIFNNTTFLRDKNMEKVGKTHDYVFTIKPEGSGKFASGDVLASFRGTTKLGKGRLQDYISYSGSKVRDIKSLVNVNEADIASGAGVYMAGNRLLVASPCIKVNGGNAAGRSFAIWSEAVAYMNGLNDKTADYVISFSDNVAAGALTFPSKAKSVTVKSEGSGQYRLSHENGVSLKTPTVLENISVQSGDGKPVFNINGKTLTLKGNAGIGKGYASIKGSGKSALLVDSSSGSSAQIACKANIAYAAVESGKLEAADLTAATIDVKSGAELKADKLASGKGAYFEPGSKVLISKKATITNLYLGKDASGNSKSGENALLSKTADAVVAINKKLGAENGSRLTMQTVDSDGNCTGSAGSSIMCLTTMKSFPIESVVLNQAGEYMAYTELAQIGKNIVVAGEWFKVREDGSSTSESFKRWSDAVDHINKADNNTKDYVIEVTEDVDTLQILTLPSKAKSLTVVGNKNGKAIKLGHLGNIKLATDTVFKNVTLESKAFDKKTGSYSTNNKANLNLNKKTLKLDDSFVQNTYKSVTGKGEMDLSSTDATGELKVTGAVTVADVSLENYKLTSTGSGINITNDTYMTSGGLDAKTNIKLKNLHSLNGNNKLSYAKKSNNSLKITGVVDSVDRSGKDLAETVSVSVNGARGSASGNCMVNNNAVDISVRYIEEAMITDTDSSGQRIEAAAYGTDAYIMKDYGYNKNTGRVTKVKTDYTKKNLVNGRDASEAYFVIERAGNTVKFVTKKEGSFIRVKATDL